MRLFFGVFSIFLAASAAHSHAQEMSVRVEAIRLLEHATAVSSPSHIRANHRQETTFRSYAPDGTIKDGTFDVIYTSDSERYETIFGDYHAISLHFPDRIVQNGYAPPPPETLSVFRLTPIVIGRFDQSDVIESISAATLHGRPAKCIQFQTINGKTYQPNEMCLDSELGTLVRRSVGDELVEDTDYVSIQGVWLPTHILYYVNGKLRLEMEQKFTIIDGPIDWAALTPPNPTILTGCRQYSRPTIQLAPQPAAAGAGPWYDVKVHGTIGEDGHIHHAATLSAGRPDLEQEAVSIVSQWTFSPAVCNGKPIPVAGTFIVHFPPH